ncbi:uncharacterized protein BDFB_002081, partial [Asbolus verrucosus]
YKYLLFQQLLGKNCDGGHYTCSPPKDCCKQGCCYLLSPSLHRPPAIPAGNFFNPLFLGHWYISSHLGLNKTNGFYLDKKRTLVKCLNFQANTIIPPPYSCMGSLEEVTTEDQSVQPPESTQLPRSASLLSSTDFYQPVHNSPSVHSHLSTTNTPSALTTPSHNNRQIVVSIRDNPCFGQNATNIVHNNNISDTTTVPNNVEQLATGRIESKSQSNCDASPYKKIKKPINTQKLPKDRSQDSESQDEDHNFSDLLNLSVCVPSSVINLGTSIQSSHHLQELQYSVTNSMTGSDISSLANLGSPDSPPRATSPTLEMKELLDKIQQLPQQKSPMPPQEPKSSKSCFHSRAKAKTLYMPLYEGPRSKGAKMFSKGWLSRSAPNTPCSNFVPSFPIHKKGSSQKSSKMAITDGSPLLKEHEESEEDANKDECL